MVKKLRNKFMVVTSILLFSLFGGFLVVNTIYTNYWNEIEIVEMLDWIAYSGIFTSFENDDTDEEALIRDITGDESPIAGIRMDYEGNIISVRVLGKDKSIELSDSVIEKMFNREGSNRKVENYYYSYTKLNDGTVLLVVMNSSLEQYTYSKVLGVFFLVLVGIALLEAIILVLSKFVTSPAEKMLLREKQFISDAGHELKTPLGAISINAQALELEYENNLYIKNIISESSRMGRLLEKLIVLAKYDEQENVNFVKINISVICEEMALTYESVAFEKQIELICEVSPDVYITGNEDEIRQLLAILIDNAVKNTKEGCTILLQCKCGKRNAEISVTNEGEGISKEVISHIYDRFYTSDTSRTSGSFGLGLAIAKTIVERHKGTISVESVPNGLTVFKVVI